MTNSTPVDAHPITSTERPRWPAGVRVAVAVVLFFTCLFGVALITIPVAGLLPDTPEAKTWLRIANQVLFCLLFILALALFVRLVERKPLAFTGFLFTRWSLPLLVLGAIASAIALALALLLATMLGLPRAEPGPATGSLLFAIVLAITQPLLLQGLPEELLFRGYVQKTLRARPWLAIVVSVVVFTIIHLVSSGGQQNLAERFIYLVMPFGFAISAAGLGLLFKSLWPAVGVHAGFHWANLVAAGFGAGSGPAWWVCLGAMHLVIGTVALVLWSRRSGTIDYRH